jgi:iron complex outermembrane recepter protein
MLGLRQIPVVAALSLALLAGVAEAQDSGPAAEQHSEAAITLPPVEVVGAAPLGGYIDRDKVPGTVQTLRSEDFTRTDSPIVTDTLFQRTPGITLSDPNGNGAAQELSYRGFFASPLQGTPQGIAVYMSGIRFNEAFGDTVNWNLIPTNAIDRSDLWTNNPVFGLNALGGAINLTMKNGFT